MKKGYATSKIEVFVDIDHGHPFGIWTTPFDEEQDLIDWWMNDFKVTPGWFDPDTLPGKFRPLLVDEALSLEFDFPNADIHTNNQSCLRIEDSVFMIPEPQR
jgi:hypothetical protein